MRKTITICDKCGHEITDKNDVYYVTLSVENSSRYNLKTKNLYLHTNCIEKFGVLEYKVSSDKKNIIAELKKSEDIDWLKLLEESIRVIVREEAEEIYDEQN